MNAPKKIWAIQGAHHPYWRLKEFPNTVPYIRADLVDGLVEALEQLAMLGNGDYYGNSVGNEIARAALAKLEEE